MTAASRQTPPPSPPGPGGGSGEDCSASPPPPAEHTAQPEPVWLAEYDSEIAAAVSLPTDASPAEATIAATQSCPQSPVRIPVLNASGRLRGTPGVLRSADSSGAEKRCSCSAKEVSFSEVVAVALPGSPLMTETSSSRVVDEEEWNGLQAFSADTRPLLSERRTCRERAARLRDSPAGVRCNIVFLVLLVSAIVVLVALGLEDRDRQKRMWYKTAQVAATSVIVAEVLVRMWVGGAGFWRRCWNVLDSAVALVCVAALAVSYVPAYTSCTGTRNEEKFFALAMRATRDIIRVWKLLGTLRFIQGAEFTIVSTPPPLP